jgi:phage baseplate assembly protein gpV
MYAHVNVTAEPASSESKRNTRFSDSSAFFFDELEYAVHVFSVHASFASSLRKP